MRPERLLWGAVFVPVAYYAVLLSGPLIFPGYDHATQYASELGGPDSPHPQIFNLTIIASGLAGLAGALGFGLALRRIGRRTAPSALATLCLALWSVAMVIGGLYPMPDPRHGAFGLGAAIQLAPVFVVWALWGAPRTGGLRLFSLAVLGVSGALFAVMMGVGGLVHRSDVGWWQRAYSAATIPWIGLAGWWLRGLLQAGAAQSRAVSAAA